MAEYKGVIRETGMGVVQYFDVVCNTEVIGKAVIFPWGNGYCWSADIGDADWEIGMDRTEKEALFSLKYAAINYIDNGEDVIFELIKKGNE